MLYRSYSAVTTGKYPSQEIDRETELQKSNIEETNKLHSISLTIHKAVQSKMLFSVMIPKLNSTTTYFTQTQQKHR